MTYQIHLIRAAGLFPLPVFGTKKNIWDALAVHVRYGTYKNWCAVTGAKHKHKFKLVVVVS